VNPLFPDEIGFYDTPGEAMNVAMIGGYALVADNLDGGLRVINVANPVAPVEIGYYNTPGGASAVAIAKDRAYVADGTGGLIVLRFPPPPPKPLSPIALRPILTARPLLDWDSMFGATSYTLQISTNQNFATFLVNINITPSAYVPTSDLPRNTLLFWRVRANFPDGPSAWSPVRHFDTGNPPGTPAPVSPANNATVTGNQPTLDWNDVTPAATYYEVLISTDQNFPLCHNE